MASLDITDVQHPVLCQPEKQEGSEPGQGLQALADSQETAMSADPALSGEPSAPAPNEATNMTPAQTPVSQEHEPAEAVHESGGMEARHNGALDDGYTEGANSRLCSEDGSPSLDHNTNAEAETTILRHPSQSEQGAVKNSVVAASVTAAVDAEIPTSPSQPAAS